MYDPEEYERKLREKEDEERKLRLREYHRIYASKRRESTRSYKRGPYKVKSDKA